ncbi:DUF5067 domain-containing protein [Ornithinibacillus bavariensis]|uniref:DUF4352 domain-containing protein n=1 Tax=Ornithinibacillus bavariensis TaxID=545502 RepID=A0A919X5U8_9BACI|nr:DUF5067 domain-containing protein [Ornithinibacillus bavariensis]GIO25559.1 hypothetical protein J43TS3_01700 [Ornithinibacillus bavariensis]
MKKILFLLVAILLSIALVACSEDKPSSSEDNNKATNTKTDEGENDSSESAEEESSEPKTFSIGDTAEVGGIKYTLKNVSQTDERNEFAGTEPAMVVKVEYEVENGSEEEIPIGADLEVYDGSGSKMELYPLDNTLGSLQPGKKIQAVGHFGIQEGPIEVYFKPLISFEEPAIFKADIK